MFATANFEKNRNYLLEYAGELISAQEADKHENKGTYLICVYVCCVCVCMGA